MFWMTRTNRMLWTATSWGITPPLRHPKTTTRPWRPRGVYLTTSMTCWRDTRTHLQWKSFRTGRHVYLWTPCLVKRGTEHLFHTTEWHRASQLKHMLSLILHLFSPFPPILVLFPPLWILDSLIQLFCLLWITFISCGSKIFTLRFTQTNNNII